ncbi:class I SAM-dependent methyltransferase family protein [Salinarchaeum chitinilyticum]
MQSPCVRAPRTDGEAVRQQLEDAELLDRDRRIAVEGEDIFVPIVDPDAVPADLEVVDHATGERETQTMPADLLAFEPSYERVGEVVVIDEDDPERARALADAIVASDVPVASVLNRASKIEGELRVREWEVLYGDSTETVHREYGCEYAVDLAQVFFSPRLATERHRVTEQVESGEQVFDMFAGVGPFVIPAAKRGAESVGVDKNPVAIEYLDANAERNGVAEQVTGITADVRETTNEYADWADRLVMNLPHSADEFLDAAMVLAGEECVLHYYDIQHEDDPFGPGIEAIEAAADAAGEEDTPGYDVTVETERVVRSYAPHEVNVCLDVRLSRR